MIVSSTPLGVFMPPINAATLTNPGLDDNIKLRLLIRESGKTQAQIADEVGIDRTYLSQMVTGKVSWTNSRYFPALVQALSMSEAQVKAVKPSAMIMVLPSVEHMHAQVPHHPDTLRSSERVRIPVYALAAAGTGIWSDEDVVDYIEVEPDVAYRQNRASFQVDGDSMEPVLSHGDYIHVDLADKDVRDGKIYVVKIKDNGIVVKRTRVYQDNTVYLVSENLDYPPIQPEAAIVIGRVFGYNQAFKPL